MWRSSLRRVSSFFLNVSSFFLSMIAVQECLLQLDASHPTKVAAPQDFISREVEQIS